MARRDELCTLVDGRFELKLFRNEDWHTGRPIYEASLFYDVKWLGRRTGDMPCTERELPDLASKMVRHLARDGFRYTVRPSVEDIMSVISLGDAAKDLINNYLRRGRSVEAWEHERGFERIGRPKEDGAPRPRL